MHMPYRLWCSVCVRAAGNHDPRRSHGQQEALGTIVSMDSCFFGSVGDENVEEDNMKIVLIIHDDTVDAIRTMKSRTGVREEVVDWVLQKLEFAGHVGTVLTMKSDQEEADVALKKAVAARRSARTVLAESHVRVSSL